MQDWNAGLRDALGSDQLLARYHEVEPAVQAEDPSLSYREVMREASRRLDVDASNLHKLARRLGLK